MRPTNTFQGSLHSGEQLPLSPESDISTDPGRLGFDPEDWEVTFQGLFNRAMNAYEDGTREPDQLVSPEDKVFLASIGTSPQEIFDFVEDCSEQGVPSPEMVRQVTGVRRDYFLRVQDRKPASSTRSSDGLPSGRTSLGGYQWLPRIIEKARTKLRGELPPDIMYGCGMDRSFLQGLNIGLAEFLKVVWEAGEDQEKILAYVDTKAKGQGNQ